MSFQRAKSNRVQASTAKGYTMKDVQLTMEEKKKIFQAIMPIWERCLFDTASAYNLELVLGDGGLTELCFHPVEIPEGVVMLSSVDSAPEKKEAAPEVTAREESVNLNHRVLRLNAQTSEVTIG